MKNTSNKPTIGIITALPHECLAVQALLLKPTETFREEGRGPYQYYLGELPSAQGHNHRVAMSLLPNMGNDSAAARATLLLTHFPSVRWIIMVGIAGGVPDPEHADEHVRLGDVVVSNQSGIIQYDFVKETLDGGKDGRIVQSPRHPSRAPSSTLTHAVKRMQVREMQGKFPWEPFIREASVSFSPVVTRPPASSDILAKSTNPAEVETHPLDVQRRDGLPRIFSGPIASSNTLLKNPLKRDALRDAFKVKAVEMEGSGVADATWDQELAGYLVIRGICDYCDVNKGDDWQRYAAVVAAAYMRALLESLPSSTVDGTPATGHGAGTQRSRDEGDEDSWWKQLTDVAAMLYQNGPDHEFIWTRAGGDLHRINVNASSGQAKWFGAIQSLRNGGGGRTITVTSLLQEMLKDYPNNAQLGEIQAKTSWID